MPTAEQPFPPNVPNWLRRFCETVYWSDAAWEIERGRQIWTAEIFKSPLFKRLDDLGFGMLRSSFRRRDHIRCCAVMPVAAVGLLLSPVSARVDSAESLGRGRSSGRKHKCFDRRDTFNGEQYVCVSVLS
jgi:hypothetical protein